MSRMFQQASAKVFYLLRGQRARRGVLLLDVTMHGSCEEELHSSLPILSIFERFGNVAASAHIISTFFSAKFK